MALPPLPANNTNRVYLDYVTGSHSGATEHTISGRFEDEVTAQDAVVFLAGIIMNGVQASNLYAGWRFTGARAQARDTNISMPVALPPAVAAFVGTGSSADWVPSSEAIEATFQGRSAISGRRVDISIYGINIGTVLQFRYAASTPNDIGALTTRVLALLNNSEFPLGLVAIDGSWPTWYQYINLQYNSYWEGRKRG